MPSSMSQTSLEMEEAFTVKEYKHAHTYGSRITIYYKSYELDF